MEKLRSKPILIEILYMLGLILFVALLAVCFLMMGISVRMEPEWMSWMTVFGWPIGIFIYMVVVGLTAGKGSDRPRDSEFL